MSQARFDASVSTVEQADDRLVGMLLGYCRELRTALATQAGEHAALKADFAAMVKERDDLKTSLAEAEKRYTDAETLKEQWYAELVALKGEAMP